MDSISIQSLAHYLREAKLRENQRFIIFLGAGASQSSGIPTASFMILDFRRRLHEIWMSKPQPKKDFIPWVRSRPGWKDNKGEPMYAKYFEAYEQTVSGRRDYLDYWINGASPSRGYFWLAQLLARSYISAVVTTNFDDLVYDSCTEASILRPRVYSNSDPYGSLNLEPDRPTIIKLHGDYLYRTFKTTGNDMKNIDDQLMVDVSNLIRGHDVIVIGYSGQDKRIMKNLFSNVSPTNAVYWCVHEDEPVPDKVLNIVQAHPEGRWLKVKTEGFDEFMDVLVKGLGFTVSSIIQPIQSLINAIPGRIEGSGSPQVDDLLNEAINHIQIEEKNWAIAHGVGSIPPSPLLLRFEAMRARRNLNYPEAKRMYSILVKLEDQETCEVLIEYGVILEQMGEYLEAQDLIPRITHILVDDSENNGNFGWLLANLGRYEEGIAYLKRAIVKGPGFNQWRAALARFLSDDGNINEALNVAQELTDLNPNDGPMWASRSMIESLAGKYSTTASRSANTAVTLNPQGFEENRALAIALSGGDNHIGAIDALGRIDRSNQLDKREDEVFYRWLGYFQILSGDSDSAVENLRKAIDASQSAVRPKVFARYGVALLTQTSQEKAKEIFQSTQRDSGRHYSVDDDLGFALCELGAGKRELGMAAIRKLSIKHRQMRGLLLETRALLSVMHEFGVDGCDQCIAEIDSVLE